MDRWRNAAALMASAFLASGITPRVADAQVVATTDPREICATIDGLSYSQRHRNVPGAAKIEVYRAAGVETTQRNAKDAQGRPLYEVDHICPLDVGCSNDRSNLQLQIGVGPWNYHDKDKLEAAAKRAICVDGAAPEDVQGWFVGGDWRAKYIQLFGPPADD